MLREIAVTRKFPYRGSCMLPLLRDGDEVWVRSIPWEDAREGDLVVFARFGGAEGPAAPSLVVHRLVRKGGTDSSRIGPDARLRWADPMRPGDFSGRVVAVRRGSTLVPLQTPRGRLCDRASFLYGKYFLGWWQDWVLKILEGWGLPTGWLHRAALVLPELVFRVLFPRELPAPAPERHWKWSEAAAILLLAALVYSNSLRNGFVWDDHIYVEGNPFVAEPANIRLLLDPRFYSENQRVQAGSRPLLLASLLVDRALWGERPSGYHLTNVLLHAANSVWVYRLGLALFPIGAAGAGPPFAMLAGLLFAVHPIQTEAVNAVSFRADLLAAFFLFAGFFALLAARRSGTRGFAAGLLVSGACYGLGLLSKEMAATLPALALLAELYLPSGRWNLRRTAAAALVFSVVAVWYAGFWAPRFRYQGIRSESFEETAARDRAAAADPARVYRAPARHYVFDPSPPPWEEAFADRKTRLLTYAGVFGEYFRLLAWPAPLAADRAPEIRRDWRSPRVLASGAALALLLAAAWLLRSRAAAPAFGIAWCFVALLPVSGLVPLYNPMAERYLYVVTAGACWAAAAGLALLSGLAGRRALAAQAVAAGLVLLACGRATHARNADWRDDRALLDAAAPGVRQNPRVFYNRAGVRLADGRVAEALRDYEAAIRMHPGYFEAWMNLGTVLKTLRRAERARACYQRAVALSPRTPLPRFIYGKFLDERGELAEAGRMYAEALRIHGGFQPARLRLGTVEYRLGRKARGLEEVEAVRRAEPGSKEVQLIAGRMYTDLGRREEARRAFTLALELDPGFAAAHDELLRLGSR